MPANSFNLAIRLSAGSSEAEWRSSVSRAYYGTFHYAREFVVDCGVILPKTAAAHEYLQWCLTRSGNSELVAVVEKVNSLRSLRNRADYDLAASEFSKQTTALTTLKRARQAIDGLESARSSPEFPNISKVIRRYAFNTLKLQVRDDHVK